MPSDTIVREAARAALASEHPVRVVVDGDKLVGIVDDEDILRVVVAEERRDGHERPPARDATARAPTSRTPRRRRRAGDHPRAGSALARR